MSDDLVLGEAKEFEPFPVFPEDTILEAIVRDAKIYTTKMIDKDTDEPVKRVKFKFEVVAPESWPGEDGTPILTTYQDKDDNTRRRTFYGETSVAFTAHEKCRLYNWTLAIMGAKEGLPTGFTLRKENDGTLSALLKKQCRIVLEVNEWDDKKNPIEDDLTGEITYPKKRNNKVKAVAKTRIGPIDTTPTSSAKDPYAEEPF